VDIMGLKSSEEKSSIVFDIRKMLFLFWRLKYIYFALTVLGLIAGYVISYTFKPTYLSTIQIKLPEYTAVSTGNTIAKIAKSSELVSDISNGLSKENAVIIESKMIRETSILQIIISSQDKTALDQFMKEYKEQVIDEIEPVANEVIKRDLEKYNLMGGSPLSIQDIAKSQVIVKPKIIDVSDTTVKVSKFKRSIIGGISGFLVAFIYMIIRYATKRY
jgi:hypothetical protein